MQFRVVDSDNRSTSIYEDNLSKDSGNLDSRFPRGYPRSSLLRVIFVLNELTRSGWPGSLDGKHGLADSPEP